MQWYDYVVLRFLTSTPPTDEGFQGGTTVLMHGALTHMTQSLHTGSTQRDDLHAPYRDIYFRLYSQVPAELPQSQPYVDPQMHTQQEPQWTPTQWDDQAEVYTPRAPMRTMRHGGRTWVLIDDQGFSSYQPQFYDSGTQQSSGRARDQGQSIK